MKKYLREKIYRFISLAFREEIIRDGFRGILGREPEEEALAAYRSSFKELGYEGLMNELSSSPEAWDKQKREHTEESIREAFRGILGREPDEVSMNAYKTGFGNLGISGLIHQISRSEEAWKKRQMERAEELMKLIYRGVTGNDPNDELLTELVYQFRLEGNNNIDRSIRNLIESNIGWEELLLTHSHRITTELYRGILGRFPDQDGYRGHKLTIEKNKELITTIKNFIESNELITAYKKRSEKETQHKNNFNNKQVFIHVEKTGGTSFQHMLIESGRKDIYHEHTSTLNKKSNEDIQRFEIFIGHFEFDEVQKKIPGAKLYSVIREPKERLVSLYNFWRAHNANSPNFWRGMELANKYSIEDFFQLVEITTWPSIWNHITYSLIGKSNWNKWNSESKNLDGYSKINWLENIVRPKIISTLEYYNKIGTLQHFDKDIKEIMESMGVNSSMEIKHDHSVKKLTSNSTFLKNNYSPQILENKRSVEQYIEIDRIIYEIVSIKNKQK